MTNGANPRKNRRRDVEATVKGRRNQSVPAARHSKQSCERLPKPPQRRSLADQKRVDDMDSTSRLHSEVVAIHPELERILITTLGQTSASALGFYCAYWNPTIRQCERNKLPSRYGSHHKLQLNPESICNAVSRLEKSALVDLLASRGPDYGLTLLVVLELLYQLAFHARKPGADQNDARSNSMRLLVESCASGAPRLLEAVSLHSDCPPIYPNFRRKLTMTIAGFLLHRKLPLAAAPRFLQQLFAFVPEIRPLHMYIDEEGKPLSPGFLPLQKRPALTQVEENLWAKARELTLGKVPESKLRWLATGLRMSADVSPLEVLQGDEFRRIDAMAATFYHLNKIALDLFESPLCLYGSAATGFATHLSDVDVVLQLGASRVEKMLTEARNIQAGGATDLNPFPCDQAPLFSNWGWLSNRSAKDAATIWAGQKLGWAIFRLLRWSVQCVPGAYVPLVRVRACVNSRGQPRPVPLPFCHPRHPTTSLSALYDSSQPWKQPFVEERLLAASIEAERRYSQLWTPKFETAALPDASLVILDHVRDSEDRGRDPAEVSMMLQSALAEHKEAAQRWREERNDIADYKGDYRLAQEAFLYPPALVELEAGRQEVDEEEELWIIEVDVSMERRAGIHNSRLLRAYAYCDSRVLAVGLLIKCWAEVHHLNDAFNGYLSGYQWTLLIIHFLQHYLCMPIPAEVMALPEYTELVADYKSCGVKPPAYLPILPNLQHVAVEGQEEERLYIDEFEGKVFVDFEHPTLGKNSPLPAFIGNSPSSSRRSKWPEDSYLLNNPLLYAYSLLTAPWDLQSPPEENPSMTPSDLSLWKARLQCTPRPPQVGADAFAPATNLEEWDRQREIVKERLLIASEGIEIHQGSGRRNSSSFCNKAPAETFPPLEPIRDLDYFSTYVVQRTQLSLPLDPTGPVTLAELLIAFFEYYGLRFNFMTEMSDIDRVPAPPAAKKEFFRTSLVVATPFEGHQEAQVQEPAPSSLTDPEEAEEEPINVASPTIVDVVDKEVLGRGNGPFQYRGRHFLCLRDPFEKSRTIGTTYKCQTNIVREFLNALIHISRARPDSPAPAWEFWRRLFLPKAGTGLNQRSHMRYVCTYILATTDNHSYHHSYETMYKDLNRKNYYDIEVPTQVQTRTQQIAAEWTIEDRSATSVSHSSGPPRASQPPDTPLRVSGSVVGASTDNSSRTPYEAAPEVRMSGMQLLERCRMHEEMVAQTQLVTPMAPPMEQLVASMESEEEILAEKTFDRQGAVRRLFSPSFVPNMGVTEDRPAGPAWRYKDCSNPREWLESRTGYILSRALQRKIPAGFGEQAETDRSLPPRPPACPKDKKSPLVSETPLPLPDQPSDLASIRSEDFGPASRVLDSLSLTTILTDGRPQLMDFLRGREGEASHVAAARGPGYSPAMRPRGARSRPQGFGSARPRTTSNAQDGVLQEIGRSAKSVTRRRPNECFRPHDGSRPRNG